MTGSKIYRLDLNIDTSKVIKAWLVNKEKEGTTYTPPQYFKIIVMQAVSSAHRTGNLAVLRRTQSIATKIDDAIKEQGKMTLPEEDYKYIKSSMDKAEWNNTLEIADSIEPIMNAINKAECVE